MNNLVLGVSGSTEQEKTLSCDSAWTSTPSWNVCAPKKAGNKWSKPQATQLEDSVDPAPEHWWRKEVIWFCPKEPYQKSLYNKMFWSRCSLPAEHHTRLCRAVTLPWRGCAQSVTPNHRNTYLWISLPQHSSLEGPCCRWVCNSPPWITLSAFSSLKCIHKRDSSFTKTLHLHKFLWHLILWQERQWKMSICISGLCDTPIEKKIKNTGLHSSNWAPNHR